MSPPRKKETVVFLDRDGTLNVDVGYPRDPSKIKFFKSVYPALRLLQNAGFKLIVITNQSGVGRGYFTEEDLDLIHSHMISELQKNEITIHSIHYCPHTPEINCNCRKPKSVLFKKAIEGLDVDIKSSFMIGDSVSDIEAGLNFGLNTILVKTGNGRKTCVILKNKKHLFHTVTTLLTAAKFILKN